MEKLIDIKDEQSISLAEKAEHSIESLSDLELIKASVAPNFKSQEKWGWENVSKAILDKMDQELSIEPSTLMDISGISEEIAISLCSAIELGRRKSDRKRRQITKPQDIYAEVRHFCLDAEQEKMIVITLNGAHEVIETFVSSMGIVNRTLVHPREIFSRAVEKRAAAICIAHNHPTGHTDPSNDDKEVTMRIKQAGKILGIKVLDHIIFSEDSYFSFQEHGLL